MLFRNWPNKDLVNREIMQNANTLTTKRFVLVSLFFMLIVAAPTDLKAETVTLNGGGASLPAPLYIKWFKEYQRAHPEVQVNYKAFGSGAGISNFTSKRIDFAGSDVPMTEEQMAKVGDGVVHVPMTAGRHRAHL
jgi:phosphate transport system substrate-binding protein